ncbi:hypothetical protein Poly59_37520 [Rubripirellula reticaptiva]|uniref:Uncharacterized protein n=1 Tax=Rubripirellula reticaptiva TaxID=2528013 RepID=A0A5C6EJZ2_9BACT|nr:hypothetical protein Poly59_37520 [Rubripirellula reticaptiva]
MKLNELPAKQAVRFYVDTLVDRLAELQFSAFQYAWVVQVRNENVASRGRRIAANKFTTKATDECPPLDHRLRYNREVVSPSAIPTDRTFHEPTIL